MSSASQHSAPILHQKVNSALYQCKREASKPTLASRAHDDAQSGQAAAAAEVGSVHMLRQSTTNAHCTKNIAQCTLYIAHCTLPPANCIQPSIGIGIVIVIIGRA